LLKLTQQHIEEKMIIKNTRMWEAINVLVYGEKDVRTRVSIACAILDKMNAKELPEDLQKRIEKVKNEAGKKGELRNINGDVIKDRYEYTSATRQNKTYSKLAKELYDIYNELNTR